MRRLPNDLLILLVSFLIVGALFVIWVLTRHLSGNATWMLFEGAEIAVNAAALTYMAMRYKLRRATTALPVVLSLLFLVAAIVLGVHGSRKGELAMFFLAMVSNALLAMSRPTPREGTFAFRFRHLLKDLRGVFDIEALFWVFFAVGALCFVVYLFFIVFNANWRIGDDRMLLTSILSGKAYPPLSMRNLGRFIPLSFVEYDPFILIGNRPYAFYLWAALKAAISGVLLLVLLQAAAQHGGETLSKPSLRRPSWGTFLSVILVALFFLTPRMFEMFAEVVFNEATLIPLLAAFIFFYCSFLRSERTSSGIITLILANLACYDKEPTFLIVGVLAVVGLIQWRSSSSKQRLLHLLMLSSALVYVILYVVLILPHIDVAYNAGRDRGAGLLGVAWRVIYQHPPMFLALAILILRTPPMIRQRRIGLYEGFLLAALAFSGAFVLLRLEITYYFNPAYVLIFPAILNFAVSNLAKERLWGKLPAFLALGVLLWGYWGTWRELADSIRIIQESRKNDMAYVKSLEGHTLYELTRKETDSNMAWYNLVDYWAVDSLEVFIDFDLNGHYTGTTKIQRLNTADELKVLKANDVLLVPMRVRDHFQIPGFLIRKDSYFYYDRYTLR